MRIYQVKWGWEPPQYDYPNGNFRLFFANEKITELQENINIRTNEKFVEEVSYWLCDVIEYEGDEAYEILRLLKEDEDSLECNRWILKAKIKAYDKSRHVEDFTIGKEHLWLDSTLRGKVEENLKTCERLGEKTTVLRFDGMIFPVTVEMGWNMYYSVLAYARDSWNVTETHLSNADGLNSSEEMKAYNFKVCYPPKLEF